MWIFELVYEQFQLKLKILVFWTKICPKRVFLVENRKRQHHHWVVHVWLSLGSKFQLKLTTLIFWTKFAQTKVFSVENGKSEHQHWVLYVQISVVTKFQVKLTILIFWIKFTQKWYFWLKTRKVNITIELSITYSNSSGYQISA